MDEEDQSQDPSGTVTVVSPLTVVVDGATVSSRADRHSEVTGLVVGDRVQVQDRAPRLPLVVGRLGDDEEVVVP